MAPDEVSDEDLLLSDDPEDFGRLYDRYADMLLGYFMRRTRDPETAADLTAETFAAALVARRRFRRGGRPVVAWLYGIAQHKLADLARRGHVDDRICRRIGIERVPLREEDVEVIAWLGDEVAAQMLEPLPPAQRDAVRAHVVEDRTYAEIAADQHTSEALVRQRVSRALRTLRRHVEVRP